MNRAKSKPTKQQRAAAAPPPRGRQDRPLATRRLTLVNEAYQKLKERILRNELPPGFQALENDLAAQLKMSRTPVREALLRLQSDGLVEVKPRHGVRVLPISRDDMCEIYQLLCCLEATAAELMASRGFAATSPEIAALEAATRVMEDTLSKGDLDGWAAADEQFHRLLLEHCGNHRLMRMAFTVWDQSHRARMLTLRLRPPPTDSAYEHRATLNAVRRGDPRAAHEIHRAHRMGAMSLILGILDEHGLWQL